LLQAGRDILAAVTGRGKVSPRYDPLLDTLRMHERAALGEADRLRKKRHWYEQELMARVGGQDRDDG
jgi:hypothetical protein